MWAPKAHKITSKTQQRHSKDTASDHFEQTCLYWAKHATDTLQHTATHGNTLQHTATHCNTRIATHSDTLQHTATQTATQHTATRCNTRNQLQRTSATCNTHLRYRKLWLFGSSRVTSRACLVENVLFNVSAAQRERVRDSLTLSS